MVDLLMSQVRYCICRAHVTVAPPRCTDLAVGSDMDNIPSKFMDSNAVRIVLCWLHVGLR